MKSPFALGLWAAAALVIVVAFIATATLSLLH
jgi:hypothetical protein